MAVTAKGIVAAATNDKTPAGYVSSGRSADEADALPANPYFAEAYHAYWKGDFRLALRQAKLATQVNPSDARAWYYQGFAQLAQAQDEQATASLARAVRLSADRPQDSAAISRALTRIQGQTRTLIEAALKEVRGASREEGARVAQAK